MTTPPPIDDVRRSMLQGIYQDGPDDGDLISLPDLVLQVAEFYGMVGPVSMKKAAGLVLNGLLGRDGWAGKPTASLDLYHATTSGNVLVRAEALCGCDDAPACGHLSPRLQALNRLPLQVTMGRDLADLGSGSSLDSPAPRYLALLRSEALTAFGVVDAAANEPATTEQPPQEPGKLIALKGWKDVKADGERLAATFKRPKNKADRWTRRSKEELRRQITELIGLGVPVNSACIMVANAWNAGLTPDDPERVTHESIATHWRGKAKPLEDAKSANEDKRRA